jgi:hypothetical protein
LQREDLQQRYYIPWLLVLVDDKDLPSKQTLTFLLFLFSLTETGGKGMELIVTFPAG